MEATDKQMILIAIRRKLRLKEFGVDVNNAPGKPSQVA
jgi:hypothetical protein